VHHKEAQREHLAANHPDRWTER
jgi:hypothetical protein